MAKTLTAAGGAKPAAMFDTILNLTQYHREHETFYSRAPLDDALQLQTASRALKALAGKWLGHHDDGSHPVGNPYAGCEDLNDTTAIETLGILFMEGEGEPAEIAKLKRDLVTLGEDNEKVGVWLDRAMQSSWESAVPLQKVPPLADLLGERHRIIANNWQNAAVGQLVGRILRRAVDVLGQVDFSPAALRADLAGARSSAGYLFAASEMLDHAADLLSQSAVLVHDSERRWRVFRTRVAEVRAAMQAAGEGPVTGGSLLGDEERPAVPSA